MRRVNSLLVGVMFLFTGLTVVASDFEKEKRWAEQVVDSLLDGEPVYLKSGDKEFLSIHTEAESGDGASAAIVIHGSGVHPDWPTVVYPLRTLLPANDWQTLSIQMPVLANEAEYSEYLPLFPEATPRIEAAIDFLKQNGAKRIVILAHSLGSRMTAYSLATQAMPIAGFAAIGMPGRSGQGNDNSLGHISRIKVPMLDLYGSEDLPEVVRSAAARKQAGLNNPAFRQIKVEGADHFFEGEEDVLLKIIIQWLADLENDQPMSSQ